MNSFDYHETTLPAVAVAVAVATAVAGALAVVVASRPQLYREEVWGWSLAKGTGLSMGHADRNGDGGGESVMGRKRGNEQGGSGGC